MIVDRYDCCGPRRRDMLAVPGLPVDVSGIDYIEVEQGATTADPTTIRIFLIEPLPLPLAALDGDNIALTGGVRYPAPAIDPVVVAVPAGGPVEQYVVTVPGGQATDFSTYRLALVAAAGSPAPPTFIDPRFSAVDFTFKIDCGSDFDCAPCEQDTDELPPDPTFDYRVRDYPGFRRQLLDRLATLVPGFREDDPVDLTTTVVEALAYRSDQQSYKLDWAGTEASLFTARSRTSLARHARLTDYRIGEGASARVFAQFDFRPGGGVADGVTLAASTPLLVRSDGMPPVIPAEAYRMALARDPIVFETVGPLRLWGWRNEIEIHTWQDEECRLPRGSTAVTLVDASAAAGPLAPGDLLLLEEIASPETGEPADARPERRHVVRLTAVEAVKDVLEAGLGLVTVRWGDADALPFDLVIQARRGNMLGGAALVPCAIARANVVLADHGASAPPPDALGLTDAEAAALRPALLPPVPPAEGRWRPVLDRADLSRIQPVAPDAERAPATTLLAVDPATCLPALRLEDDFSTWSARSDLLESGAFTRDFVVETAIDGRATVRFGDGVHGLPPAPEGVLVPRGRFGFGPVGNIGPDALAHVVLPASQAGATITVRNPLAARGGAAAEPASSIRIAAPEAFRRQERAVTAADYAEVATRHEEVANAVAIPRWTGAWHTILIYVDRKGGLPVDPGFAETILRFIERYRLMGFDTAVREAKSAPLDVELVVCAKPGELRSTVARRVRDALRPLGPGGIRGFFHPDNFTFGSPLYLSRLIRAVLGVEGVQSAEPVKFQRLDRLPQAELEAGVLRPGDFEVLRLDDDPSFPERGRLTLSMAGGR